MLTLLVALPDGTQRMVDVLRSRITIGRLPYNAICIPDSSVSREHALLVQENAIWAISDFRTANGTWLNERKISRAELTRGDVVRIGAARLTVVAPPSLSAERSATASLKPRSSSTRAANGWSWSAASGAGSISCVLSSLDDRRVLGRFNR